MKNCRKLGLTFAIVLSACSATEMKASGSGIQSIGSDDDIGGTDGGDPENPEEIPPNTCLTDPATGYYGYRHHCGGNYQFSFVGEADDMPIDESFWIGFGPTYAEPEIEPYDTYETPLIAACCGGPYDLERNSIDQFNYFENCKADAVQTLCELVPAYLKKVAEDYGDIKKAAVEGIANNMLSQENQNDCINSLYEGVVFDQEGLPLPDNHYLKITDTSWHYVANLIDLTIHVDELELLEIAYPPPPDLAICEDFYENDDNVFPVLDGLLDGAFLENFGIQSGGGQLRKDSSFIQAVDPKEGYLSVAHLPPSPSGSGIALRNLLLRDTTSTTIDFERTDYVIDRWTIGLVGPVEVPVGAAAFFPARSVAFTATVSYGEAIYEKTGYNSDDFTLTQTSTGWELSNLRLVFEDEGSLWEYSLDDLRFTP